MGKLHFLGWILVAFCIAIIFACSKPVLQNSTINGTSIRDEGDLQAADTMYIGKFFKVGDFDGSGNGIFNRTIVRWSYLNPILEPGLKGKVSAIVCIEKRGHVTFAQIINSECTIRDRKTLRSFLELIRDCWYEKSWDAPSHQCGRLDFHVISENRVVTSDGYTYEYGMTTSKLISTGTEIRSDSLPYDGSGDGVFRRKIIYRDVSATRAVMNTSGKVATKVCINRAGIVTYVELINEETTIQDKNVLRAYLKAARGYKFQPDPDAPKEQCGKLSFMIMAH